MRYKKILLVANDNLEILNAQRELSTYCSGHTLHFARNGTDALSLLMGCSSPHLENYTITGKVRPDILILDADAPELQTEELLGVIQKYYSLRKIKVFLMASDPGKIIVSEICKPGISGYLSKPLNLDKGFHDADKLKSEFIISEHKLFMPIIGINFYKPALSRVTTCLQKIKMIAVRFAGNAVIKSLGAISVIMGGSVILYENHDTARPEVEIKNNSILIHEELPEVKTEKQSLQPDTLDITSKADLSRYGRKQVKKQQRKIRETDQIPAVEPSITNHSTSVNKRNFKIMIREDESENHE